MKKVLLMSVVSICIIAPTAFAGDPVVVWNKVYDSGKTDEAYGVAVDDSGSVYVAGMTTGGIYDWDICVVKYNSDGDLQWVETYDAGDDDIGYDVALDAAENAYVVGRSYIGFHNDFRIIKYDSDGNILWNKTYDAGNADCANGVVVDDSGYVYVAGYSRNASLDFRTIKYDSDGNIQWNMAYDNSDNNDEAYGVAVDDSGNVYVAGTTSSGVYDWSICVVKYDSDGNILWNMVYRDDQGNGDYAYGVAADATGNVYVAGCTEIPPPLIDIRIMKYDSDGNILWNMTYDAENQDYAYDVAVDDSGYVYVAGRSFNDLNVTDCFRIMKYDSDGNILWNMTYDSGDHDCANSVAVDNSGYVYITGCSGYDSGADFRTIKYQQATAVTEPAFPCSESSVTLEVIHDFSPNPLIRYLIPQGQQASLTFYSADGRKIASYPLDSSRSTFTWDAGNTPAGVYFACLVVGDQSKSCKVVIVR